MVINLKLTIHGYDLPYNSNVTETGGEVTIAAGCDEAIIIRRIDGACGFKAGYGYTTQSAD